jgi:hypothetical protein
MAIRGKRLRWHVEVEDYFGTLATVLDLLTQRLEQSGFSSIEAKLLMEVVEELVYLQEGYRIVSREEPTRPDALWFNRCSRGGSY